MDDDEGVSVTASTLPDYSFTTWIKGHPVYSVRNGIEYVKVIVKRLVSDYMIKEINDDYRRED